MALFSLSILLISIQATADFFILSSKNNLANQPTAKILSYNMEFAYPLTLNECEVNPQEAEKFQQFLNQLQPLDILCVQDVRSNAHNILRELLPFSYYYFSESLHSGIYSVYPVIDRGSITFQEAFNGTCTWADIAFPKDTLRIYNFHLQSNRPWGALLEYEDGGLLKRDKFEILRIFYNYPGYSQRRGMQVRTILAHATKSPYPTILCGDLNDIPQSLPYSYLKKGRKDTFREAGFGLGHTHQVPGIRIDHIFVDHKIEVGLHKIHKVNFSDHYPIETQIYLPN